MEGAVYNFSKEHWYFYTLIGYYIAAMLTGMLITYGQLELLRYLSTIPFIEAITDDMLSGKDLFS